MRDKNVARTYSSVGIVMDLHERETKPKENRPSLNELLGFFNGIAKANNQIRIKDVKDGPILDWILRSGLTQEECVQGTYLPPHAYIAIWTPASGPKV